MILTILGFVFLIVCLAISVYYNIKFARIIFDAEDSIEESLDILDEVYTDLSKIAEKEIFFDSPEVRDAVASIAAARDVVLFVANSISSIDSDVIFDEEAS